MIRLCEACYCEILEGEPFVTLRALYKVAPDGYPNWRNLYLHHYDPAIQTCKVNTRPPCDRNDVERGTSAN